MRLKNRSPLSVIVFGFFAFCLLFAGCFALSNVEYSEGYREGTLQKLSNRGLIWKTWDGEVALWGFGGSQSKNLDSQKFLICGLFL